MSKVGKVILGVGIAFVVIVVITVAGVVYWWSYGGGKELARNAAKGIEKMEKEGENYGKSVDNEACVDEALTRDKANSSLSIGEAISTQLFLQGCLRTSRETPGFCDGVPKPTQIIDGPKWQVEQCQKRAPHDQFCPQVFQKVEEHCYRVQH